MVRQHWCRSGSITTIITLLIGVLIFVWACGPRERTIEFEFHEGTDMEAVPSPDGRQIALQLWQHIWILDVDSGEARPLTNPITPPEEHWFPRWSPDGSSIVFFSLRTDAGLSVIPASGGTPAHLTEGEFDAWASWSPDGKTIVFDRLFGALWTIPAEGGAPKCITADTIQAQQPSWSPDGKWIAFSSDGHLSIIAPDGSSLKQVTKGSKDQAPSWSPDGKNLFFISERSDLPQVWTVSIEGGKPRQLTEESDVYIYAPQWMAGREVLVYTAGGKIHTLDPNTGAQDIIPFRARLTLSRKPYKRRRPKIPRPGERLPVRGIYRPVSSPDGKNIAFASLGDLWLRHEDRRVEQLTSGPADDCDPSWSPDSKNICFVSNRNGDYQVWTVSVKDLTLSQVTDIPGDANTPLWHPSGESIVFTHSSSPPLKVVSASGGVPEPIIKDFGFDVRPVGWIPYDQSLVYSKLSYHPTTYEMNTEIGRVTLDGKPLQLQVDVPGQADFVALSPKGDTLAYVSHGELWTRRIGQDTVSQLLTPGPAFFPTWSVDNRILYTSGGKLMGVDADTGEMRHISIDLSYDVAPAAGTLLLRNARLLTPEPKEGLWDLYIKDGRIKSIEKSGDHSRKPDRVLDVEGRTVIPGLFDSYGAVFPRFPAEGHLYWGVTSVGGAGGPGHWLVTQQEAIRSGRRAGPRIFPACGFIVPSRVNAFPQFLRIKTQEQLERYLDHLIGLGATQVKYHARGGPWVEAATVSAAHRRGLPVQSHFILPASVAAGLDRKEHSWYYDWQGGATEKFRQDVIEIMRKAEITLDTTFIVAGYYSDLCDARFEDALSRPEVSSFLPPAQIERFRRQIERKFPEATNLHWKLAQEAGKANVLAAHNAGVRVVVGTDFSIFLGFIAVHWEMELLVEAGFSPLEALRAATRDAAATLGLEEQLGIIAPGAVADLVVLEADPLEDIRNTQKIYSVIKDGNIIDRNALVKEK